MRRGEVWTLCDPEGRASRVVVLSSDRHNDLPDALPHVALIVRRPAGGERPQQYLARLGEADPIAGVVVVSDIGQVHPRYGVEQVGMLTGASMDAICSVMRDLYELN